ncbi:hypothetical protein [Robertkochia aurantiaca]|uniref:hypothetical protein n=1 Tax=Robertkochia aurantiaca TaxID=2873700 RepID=UPI001CCFB121|nr:hypothetical protein [Robertkochia sp. 3YJGBD-33]
MIRKVWYVWKMASASLVTQKIKIAIAWAKLTRLKPQGFYSFTTLKISTPCGGVLAISQGVQQ